MAKKKRMTEGEGWSFEGASELDALPAGPASPDAESATPARRPQVRKEKRKKGKVVTAILDLPLGKGELAALTRELKTHCGVGGSCKDGIIELQGEQVETVRELLRARGLL